MPTVQEMVNDLLEDSSVANIAYELDLSCATIYNARNGKPVSEVTRNVIYTAFTKMWREINDEASLIYSPGR